MDFKNLCNFCQKNSGRLTFSRKNGKFEAEVSVAPFLSALNFCLGSYGSSRRKSGKKSLGRLTEDEMLELYKMSFGGSKNSEEERRKEEEMRRKLMRKPSRKISREGDYLVIQDRKATYYLPCS